jgi:hypothetical protein
VVEVLGDSGLEIAQRRPLGCLQIQQNAKLGLAAGPARKQHQMAGTSTISIMTGCSPSGREFEYVTGSRGKPHTNSPPR